MSNAPPPPPDVAAERHIDAALVRALLTEQAPRLADAPIRRLAEGWDNVLFRVGDDHIARLPRREMNLQGMRNELRWLPALAPRLPFPVPARVLEGRPGAGYPWPWALTPWVAGRVLGTGEGVHAAGLAEDLGRFLGALHRLPLPPDPPVSPFRGVDLPTRTEKIEATLARISEVVDAPALSRIWARVARPFPGPPAWCHGDLHPFNLLVRGGRLASVLDWGDLHGRDPAVDLAGVWMGLPVRQHARFREAYGGVDEALWRRGVGWGLSFGAVILDAGRRGGGQGFVDVGRVTLERVAEVG